MPSRKRIEEFLQQRRIAVVGVSRNTQEFANSIFRQFRSKGYEVVPVNPAAEQVEGVRCYPSVRDLPEPVDGVMVIVPPTQALSVVQDCQARGVTRIWFHKGGGPGTASPEALALAQQAGMSVIDGGCPMMFLGSWPHKIHRFFTKLDP